MDMKANTKKFIQCFETLVQLEQDLGIIGNEGKEYSRHEKEAKIKEYNNLIKKALVYQSKITQDEYDNYVRVNEYIVEYCYEEDVNGWISNGIPFCAQN